MAIRIEDNFVALEVDGAVVATARSSKDVAADGNGVAAMISYQHAYELVMSHGETGATAHLLPFTVDGLIWAASSVVLDAVAGATPYHR